MQDHELFPPAFTAVMSRDYESTSSTANTVCSRQNKSPTALFSVSSSPAFPNFGTATTSLTPRMAKCELGLPPIPGMPMPWVWTCHLCHSKYFLGVTSRCLVDGHYYCSGKATDKNTRTRHRGKLCTSDFDYLGWEKMNEWRKEVRNLMKSEGSWRSGCWNDCVFPSACRYLPFLRSKNTASPPEGKNNDGEWVSFNTKGEVGLTFFLLLSHYLHYSSSRL